MNLSLKKKLITFFAKITLLSYVGFGILSFFHIASMIDMSMSMDDCPFAHVLDTVGGNSITNHLQILELPLVTVLSALTISLAIVVLFLFEDIYSILYTFDLNHSEIKKKKHRLRRSMYTFLYSQGILNPKIF